MVHEVRIGEWLILDQTKENSNFSIYTPTDIAILATRVLPVLSVEGQNHTLYNKLTYHLVGLMTGA